MSSEPLTCCGQFRNGKLCNGAIPKKKSLPIKPDIFPPRRSHTFDDLRFLGVQNRPLETYDTSLKHEIFEKEIKSFEEVFALIASKAAQEEFSLNDVTKLQYLLPPIPTATHTSHRQMAYQFDQWCKMIAPSPSKPERQIYAGRVAPPPPTPPTPPKHQPITQEFEKSFYKYPIPPPRSPQQKPSLLKRCQSRMHLSPPTKSRIDGIENETCDELKEFSTYADAEYSSDLEKTFNVANCLFESEEDIKSLNDLRTLSESDSSTSNEFSLCCDSPPTTRTYNLITGVVTEDYPITPTGTYYENLKNLEKSYNDNCFDYLSEEYVVSDTERYSRKRRMKETSV